MIIHININGEKMSILIKDVTLNNHQTNIYIEGNRIKEIGDMVVEAETIIYAIEDIKIFFL